MTDRKLTVWKALLKNIPEQEISLPVDAHIIHAGSGVTKMPVSLSLWFLCDPTAALETRTIFITETGALAPDYEGAVHLKTVVFDDGYVLHIFEKLKDGE